jgi:hypothetical protein
MLVSTQKPDGPADGHTKTRGKPHATGPKGRKLLARSELPADIRIGHRTAGGKLFPV